MNIIIPIRLATALIGLLIGYYGGVWIEHKSKYKDLISFIVDANKIASKAYAAASNKVPILDFDDDYTDNDEDDDFPPQEDECFTETDSCDTDYSQEECMWPA